MQPIMQAEKEGIKLEVHRRTGRKSLLLIPLVTLFLWILSIQSFFSCARNPVAIDTALLPVEERARLLLRQTPLIDGHNDLLIRLRALRNNRIYDPDFTKKFEEGGMEGETDLPRLREGIQGGAFWSAFMPCPKNVTDFADTNYYPVVRATLEQLDLFHRLRMQYPRHFTPPTDSAEAEAMFKEGRMISPLAIEGLHQIGNSLSTLRLYHSLGVRYATLTWNCHNAFADAALETKDGKTSVAIPYWGGVSKAGQTLIKEMNRMGMLVDLSHVSVDVMKLVLNGTRDGEWEGSIAPPLFSHSSAHAICPHPRNVPDDVLMLVKERGSVVMVNFNPEFISCVPSDSASGLPDLYRPNATLHQVVRHIRYIGELIGYDHVGLGSDFDGIELVPQGLEDVSRFPDLVAELLRQGISNEDVGKVIGGNLLRVWRAADEVAARLQKEMTPVEDQLERLEELAELR